MAHGAAEKEKADDAGFDRNREIDVMRIAVKAFELGRCIHILGVGKRKVVESGPKESVVLESHQSNLPDVGAAGTATMRSFDKAFKENRGHEAQDDAQQDQRGHQLPA